MTELYTSFGRAVRHKSIINNAQVVDHFKEQLKEGDREAALESLVRCKNQDDQSYMLKTVIDTRKNDDVRQVLEKTKEYFNHDTKDDTATGDKAAGDTAAETATGDTDADDTAADEKTDAVYQKSILIATLNDDPETLKEILRWGEENTMCNESPNQVEENPILLSSLEGYTKCMMYLYKAGFRIKLFEEDWRGVKDQTQNDQLKLVSLYNPETKEENNAERKTFVQKIIQSLACLVFRNVQGKKETRSNRDPVNRYLLFKAFANQDYLSMQLIYKKEETRIEDVDPLRKAFALGTYAKLLAGYFTEHSAEYKMIGEHCEKYATDILAHCHNTKDVNKLLLHEPMEDTENEEYKYSNWQMALWGGHKSFVAHPYYQHFAWKKLKGTHFDSYKFTFFGKLLGIPFAILLILMYIPAMLGDSFFREGPLLWETPEQFKARKLLRKKALNEQALIMGLKGNLNDNKIQVTSEDAEEEFENSYWAFIRERLHRPVYRMYTSALCEVFFLILLYLAFIQENNGVVDYNWKDLVIWTFIAHFLFEDLVDLFIRKWDFFDSFWNCYTLFTNSLILLGAAIALAGHKDSVTDKRSELSGNNAVNIGLTLVAYGGTMHVLRTLRWFLLHKKIGPVIVCFIRVLRDVIYVFVVFIIIYLAFVLGIWFMYKPFTVVGGGVDEISGNCTKNSTYCIGDRNIIDNKGMRGIFSHIFWKVFDGDAKEDSRIQTKEEFNNNSTVFSLEFSHVMGYSMWAMYQGITVILLINILIAQMNSTYLRVWENADAEWKYSKSFFQVQFLTPRAVLPPPFRWFYYFARLIKFLRERSQSWAPLVKTTDEKLKQKENYVELLQKLVKTKMHSEAEASRREDFKDLRLDIQNEISELKKIMMAGKIIPENSNAKNSQNAKVWKL